MERAFRSLTLKDYMSCLSTDSVCACLSPPSRKVEIIRTPDTLAGQEGPRNALALLAFPSPLQFSPFFPGYILQFFSAVAMSGAGPTREPSTRSFPLCFLLKKGFLGATFSRGLVLECSSEALGAMRLPETTSVESIPLLRELFLFFCLIERKAFSY